MAEEGPNVASSYLSDDPSEKSIQYCTVKAEKVSGAVELRNGARVGKLNKGGRV